MTSTHEAVGNRLPDAGAGFFWELERSAAREVVWLRPLTDRARAAYTTRTGGLSTGALSSLNVSWDAEAAEGDDHGRERVLANRWIAGRLVGSGPMWSSTRQVHGAEVVRAGSPSREADAIWTQDADRTLAVVSADCVLLLVVGESSVGVAHAGWRGILAGVIESTVRAVEGRAEVFAGPAIGPCCFEVGAEVADAFRARLPGALVDDGHVDLWRAAEEAALRAGAASATSARVCTSCHPDLFFSHRRDRGRTGRQALLARLGSGPDEGPHG